MFSVRLATKDDVDEICSFDQISRQEKARVEFIEKAIRSKSCYVATSDQIDGYAVLEYTFFENGFMSMLYVRSDARRHGVGAVLVQHLEKICETDKLFTSTNLSNQPMQSMLDKLGYKLSGIIHDLDDDDPELIYVKNLL